MRPKHRGISRSIVILLTLYLWTCVVADAQQLPRSLTIGANPPGTVFYALASGLAKFASEGAPFQIQHTPNARLVMRGSVLLTAPLVRKDSPIKTIHDIRGKRVTGEYPAQLANWYNLFGYLSGAGMKWEDVKIVPVPGVNEGIDALVQGRADVSLCALDAAKVKEADAAVGVRHISMDCSPEGEKRLRRAVPGYYPHWLKRGQATAVVEDTCVNAYDIYLTSHKGAADRVISTVLKGVWDNIDKLPSLHPSFKDWTRQRAVDPDVTLPYHPAAVQYFKERGVWSVALDDAQRKLLGFNP